MHLDAKLRRDFPTSVSEMSAIVEGEYFQQLYKLIAADYSHLYQTKMSGSAKYEHFQMAMFFGIRDYIYSSGAKHDITCNVFRGHDEILEKIFPAIYQCICDTLQVYVVKLLSSSSRTSHLQKELMEEDEGQLYRMHGWVLFELLTKSKHTEIVKEFKLVDKSRIPQAMKFLDVGTNTGLTFPKIAFMDFMRASDRFVRSVLADNNFQLYGNNIVKVAKTLTHSNVDLEEQFYFACNVCCSRCDKDVASTIYTEWIEKLINMKMKGRLESIDRQLTEKSKRITTKTQNLRDNLLSKHVQ